MDDGKERRRHIRLCASFPVMVRGQDTSGESFEVNTVLDNISAGGLYVRLGRCVKQSTKLFAVVRLSTTPAGREARAKEGYLVRAWRWVVRQVVRVYAMVVRPSTTPANAVSGPRVATRGVVVRVEPQPNGMYGVAVAFSRHRFL